MPYSKKFTDIYEQWVKRSPKEIVNWLNAEIEYLKKNLKRDSRVLDVGCGYGRVVEAIAKYHKEIWGVDNTKIQSTKAKKNLKRLKNVYLKLGDAEKMNFPNNYFDYVVCMANTFGNLGRNKLKVLRKMKRVTKMGGTIVVSVYNNRGKTLDIRLDSYKKLCFPIKTISKKKKITIIALETCETLITEQFSKKQLEDIFKKAELEVKIKPLTKIGYICEARVNKNVRSQT